MDRSTAVRPSEPRPDDFILPSRARAIGRLREAIEAADGPVLVTGAAGVGKSWMVRRAIETLAEDWRWATVALSPAVGPIGLDRLTLHAFGLGGRGARVTGRPALHDALIEAVTEGRRWGLVVEEAHNGSDAVLEELRVLADGLGEPGRLAGVVLVGQTALSRRLAADRALAPLDVRVTARVVLGRLDVDELHGLLERLQPSLSLSASEIDQLHRAIEGNPVRALRLARSTGTERVGQAEVKPALAPSPGPPAWQAVPVVAPKPPIEIGEETVEVGWEGSNESSAESELPVVALLDGDDPDQEKAATVYDRVEEPINDHYAALQAWGDWAQTHDREPVPHDAPVVDDEAEDADADPEPDTEPDSSSPSVWSEGHHGFAPYGQLFSRLRQRNDPQ